MNVFQRRRRKPSKGRVLLCPISFLLQFDLCQSLCWFELGFCFACCLLDYCNSGLHLSPESPDSWKVIFTLRARKEFSQKKKRKSRWPTLQRPEPEPLSDLPRDLWGSKRRLTAVYHSKWFVRKGTKGRWLFGSLQIIKVLLFSLWEGV